ncbi:hypothetical protein [Zoogloea sp.]|uniref:hypothetical protein n=1 Tax=Zoogloea sp. TaxID=49181 RepID=UPI0026253DE8|nr:hypothetical protein [Zoogloea sp.]
MNALNSEFRPMSEAPKDGSEILLVFAEEAEVLGKQCGQVRAAHWTNGDWSIAYWKRNPPIGWMPLLSNGSKVLSERDLLRAALAQLVGASSRAELEGLRTVLSAVPASSADRAAMDAAIDALLKTCPEGA